MSRLVQVPLHEALAAPEGRDGLAGGRLEHLRDFLHRPGDLQSAAPAAERGLDRDGEAVLLRERDHLIGICHRVCRARHQGGAHLLRDVAGLHLVSERLDGPWRGTDPDQAGVDDGLREVGVLGEKAVAGVHGVRARAGRHIQQFGDVQVGVRRGGAVEGVGLVGQLDEQRLGIGIRIDGHGIDARVPGGADHADGDLASISDQNLGDGDVAHSLPPVFGFVAESIQVRRATLSGVHSL